jgi:hypothetical protein
VLEVLSAEEGKRSKGQSSEFNPFFFKRAVSLEPTSIPWLSTIKDTFKPIIHFQQRLELYLLNLFDPSLIFTNLLGQDIL